MLHRPMALGRHTLTRTPSKSATRTESRAAELISRWQSGSVVNGWSYKEDWWTPAVAAVIDAVNGVGGDPVAAAERLGRERARAGVGLGDALTDLAQGLDLLRCSRRVHAGLANAMSRGWAESVITWLSSGRFGSVDVLTELATRDYLTTRLTELYRECDAAGIAATKSRVLVAVGVRSSSQSIVTEQRMVGVGHALASVFTGGETLARVGPSVAVALAHRDETLNDLLVALQLELSWTGMSERPIGARTWFEPLPADFKLVVRLLNEMCA
ncbi:hypothetical protein ACSMXN_00245 [Jatrophihabitans sp. DSM 45814]